MKLTKRYKDDENPVLALEESDNDALRISITTTEYARKFIQFLIQNNLMFHLDDDVDNIIWGQDVDEKTIKLIGERHQELWKVGNPWEYAEDIIDVCLEN